MTDTKYKLSISIPTYGYPEAVKANVERLLKIKRDDVEIVVVDNDDTGTQIKEYMQKVPDKRFSYYQNDTNIGRSNNIVKAVEMASSDNVMLVSSDDIVFPDAIDDIIETISNNPDFSVLMGSIKTNLGNYDVYFDHDGKYSSGYEAVMNLPFMGNLYPIVINKRSLKINELYDNDETYMQHRLALAVANDGDFLFLNRSFGEIYDNMWYRFNEPPENFRLGIGLVSHNVGNCYYSPQARAEQFLMDVELIERFNMRQSHFLRILDKWLTIHMFEALSYISICRDPYMLTHTGNIGFVGYRDALGLFRDNIMPFFEQREKDGKYYFTGKISDKINNELLILKETEIIVSEIEKNDHIYVYGNSTESQKTYMALEKMGYKVTGLIADIDYDSTDDKNGDNDNPVRIVKGSEINMDGIALVPLYYNGKIQVRLQNLGLKKIYYLDWMRRYLTFIWCDRHRESTDLGQWILENGSGM